jgi:hypothetical protein
MQPLTTTTKLARFGAVLIIGLWASRVTPAASLYCNDNLICETNLGETAANCGDCGYCGDSTCGPNEVCQECPDDCYSQCVCGDSVCSYPAEGSGEGSGEWCGSSPLGSNCHYCPQDCVPACAYPYCYFSGQQGCDSSTGLCGVCQDDGWCDVNGGYICDGGECVYQPMCPVR